MAREVEILVPVESDPQECHRALTEFESMSISQTIDTYYYDPLRADLQPDDDGRIRACMRVRTKDGFDGGWIAYKSDVFDGDEWLYSNENETHVADAEEARNIIHHLGLKVLTIVNSKKHVYMTVDGTKEIVYEEVENLGRFLEVESKTQVEEDQVAIVKQGLRDFISNELKLEIGPELNAGKPELLLRQQEFKPLEQ
jgi:predicted adenylyl cyclase CyaB